MALRDQPYLPLYVQDFLTDEKLNECGAEAHGIYIKLMCLLHKSETYGKILLEQKYKQTDKPLVNFARKFARHMPFDFNEILSGLSELTFAGVVEFNENEIWQKRMVRDDEISNLRAEAGSKGGKNAQFAIAKDKANTQAKHQANTENEIEIENTIEIDKEKRVIGGKTEKTKREVIIPWDTENFKKWWNIWREYKSKEHKFNYKSEISEQAALRELADMSQGKEELAVKIIEHTIAHAWKGFVLPEVKVNGAKSNTISDSYKQSIINDLTNG